jgi:hypothetical protein
MCNYYIALSGNHFHVEFQISIVVFCSRINSNSFSPFPSSSLLSLKSLLHFHNKNSFRIHSSIAHSYPTLRWRNSVYQQLQLGPWTSLSVLSLCLSLSLSLSFIHTLTQINSHTNFVVLLFLEYWHRNWGTGKGWQCGLSSTADPGFRLWVWSPIFLFRYSGYPLDDTLEKRSPYNLSSKLGLFLEESSTTPNCADINMDQLGKTGAIYPKMGKTQNIVRGLL